MRNIIKYWIWLLIAIFLLGSYAFSVTIDRYEAHVDRNQIKLGEILKLTVTIEGKEVSKISEPTLPDLDGFEVLSSSSSSSFSWINGKVSSSINYDYTLSPTKAGELKIDAVQLPYGNQVLKTPPIPITVLSGNTPSQAPQPPPSTPMNRQIPPQSQTPPSDNSSDIFVRGSVDKDTVYLGEQLIYTFGLYRAINLDSIEFAPPDTTGFWKEALEPEKRGYQMIRGKRFLVQEALTALFPTTTGELTIGPASIKCVTDTFSSFFQRPFGTPFMNTMKPRILSTDPITIKVLPLPKAGQPENFTGSVGQFKMNVALNKTQIEVGQPLEYTVIIEGQGNIKTVSELKTEALPDFKIYDSESKENVYKNNYQVSGSKIFKYLIIPRVQGEHEIPPVSFSYFDPEAKSYQTITSKSFQITALPSSQPEQLASSPQSVILPDKQNIQLLASDILYIKTPAGFLKKNNQPLYKENLLQIYLLLPPIFVVFCAWLRKRQQKIAQDIQYARFLRARKTCQKIIKQARQKMHSESKEEFYGLLSKALTDYLWNRLNINPGQTRDLVIEELINKGLPKPTINFFEEFLNNCELARFAPATYNKKQMEKHLQEAQDVLYSFEKSPAVKKEKANYL